MSADHTAGTGAQGPATIVRAMPDEANAAAAADLVHERDRLRAVAASLPALERDVQRLRADLAAIEASPAWRLTAPLRGARALVASRRELALAAGRRVERPPERGCRRSRSRSRC